ncbi:MAG: hypothetical protein FD123_3736 [Bacteroidetes bacterium]|nr:MAG: hypothetical protein FD123_3736 [Bacteroidota bacterium]
MYATGKEVNFVYEDHHLFIKFTKNGKAADRELFSFSELSDKHFEVIFCGDIDGDTVPDFILETGWHYNLREPALFLSGAAGEDRLYKIVATHKSYGC